MYVHFLTYTFHPKVTIPRSSQISEEEQLLTIIGFVAFTQILRGVSGSGYRASAKCPAQCKLGTLQLLAEGKRAVCACKLSQAITLYYNTLLLLYTLLPGNVYSVDRNVLHTTVLFVCGSCVCLLFIMMRVYSNILRNSSNCIIILIVYLITSLSVAEPWF